MATTRFYRTGVTTIIDGRRSHRGRLVQLDAITRRVVQERLSTGADRLWIGHLDAVGPHVGDCDVDVIDRDGEVLAEVVWWRRLDEVDLLSPGIEPGTSEPEVGSVRTRREAQHVDVELQRGGDVAHIDRNVMDTERSHPISVA